MLIDHWRNTGRTVSNWGRETTKWTEGNHVTLSNMPLSTFLLSNKGSVPLTFDAPVLLATNRSIVSPMVIGALQRGASITALGADSHVHKDLTVVYNCISPGSTTMELHIPLINFQPIAFRWELVCVGTARRDFTVQPWSTTRRIGDAHTVTRIANYLGLFSAAVWDGSSCRCESCSRGAVCARWAGGFVVDAVDDTTSFLLYMHENRTKPSFQAFLQPIVVASRPIAVPVLGGSARRGGTAYPAAPPINNYSIDDRVLVLDVAYNCVATGDVNITVNISFPSDNYATASFTWLKHCRVATQSPTREQTQIEPTAAATTGIPTSRMPTTQAPSTSVPLPALTIDASSGAARRCGCRSLPALRTPCTLKHHILKSHNCYY